MPLKPKKQSLSQLKKQGLAQYTFSNCLHCGVDINNQADYFVVTAGKHTYCISCFEKQGWNNVKQNYKQSQQAKTVKLKSYKND